MASTSRQPTSRAKISRPARADANAEASALLADANAAAVTARGSWLAFLGVITYVLVTLASVSHRMLLLDERVHLPIVNTDVPLSAFFLAGPILLVTVHLGLLSQHVMLAKKYHQFNKAVFGRERVNLRSDADRWRVNSYVFAQLLAGPRQPPIVAMLMYGIVLFTFILMPLLTLLLFQLQYLPAQNLSVIWIHRITLFLDLSVLCILWPFTRLLVWHHPRSIQFPREKKRKTREKKRKRWPKGWRWRVTRPGALACGGAAIATLMFSWLVATIAYEAPEQFAARLDPFAVDVWDGLSYPEGQHKFRRTSFLTNLLFDGQLTRRFQPPEHAGQSDLAMALNRLTPAFSVILWGTDWIAKNSRLSRHIVADKLDLVPDRDNEPDERSILLGGRNLRNAILVEADLHRADLQGATLNGAIMASAILKEADLRHAKLFGADLADARLQEAKLEGADLRHANLFSAKLEGADLRGADLSETNLINASLTGANLVAIKLQGADLSAVDLKGADLTGAGLQDANLQGANLQGAHLLGANLQGANLQGANLLGTTLPGRNLQGANLQDANLLGADLRGADLRGANLQGANLLGADLRDANLQGATLNHANLQNAAVSANIKGADLRGSTWSQLPSNLEGDKDLLVDFREHKVRPLSEIEIDEIVKSIRDEALSIRIKQIIEKRGAMDLTDSASPDNIESPPDPNNLSAFLADLACEFDKIFDEATGEVIRRYPLTATQIVNRVTAESFNGDRFVFYDEFDGCEAAAAVQPDLMDQLQALALVCSVTVDSTGASSANAQETDKFDTEPNEFGARLLRSCPVQGG